MKKILSVTRVMIFSSVLALTLILQTSAQLPAKEYGFGFDNFKDLSVSWEIFQNSFYGIPESSAAAAFDALFYELGFKEKICASGNCFGMSLLSILMNRDGGHMGYCAPPYQYSGDMNYGGGPSDAKLRRVINILQGHQLSLACIMEMLDQITGLHSQDGSKVIKRCEATIAKEGPCIISVTKTLNPSDGGHAMIAYAVAGDKIMVVDPNRVWANTNDGHRDWYEGDLNYIECMPGNWKFFLNDTITWPTSKGHLTVYPVSVAEPTGRTPTSLGLNVSDLLAKIFIVSKSSGATILQVSDASGKRLFLPDSKAIDVDSASGMRSIVPWFPSVTSENAGPFPFELYFSIRTPSYLEVEFITGKTGAVFALGSSASFVRIDCSTPEDTVLVAVSGIGTSAPSYKILRSSRSMAI
ncbi:MAG: hypothetical protein WC824_09390, partial [Bacteroidota bacterium]